MSPPHAGPAPSTRAASGDRRPRPRPCWFRAWAVVPAPPAAGRRDGCHLAAHRTAVSQVIRVLGCNPGPMTCRAPTPTWWGPAPGKHFSTLAIIPTAPRDPARSWACGDSRRWRAVRCSLHCGVPAPAHPDSDTPLPKITSTRRSQLCNTNG